MTGKGNTKTKTKDEKGKANVNDDSEDIDFASLRKPIHTSITGFAQARKIFDLMTEELKSLMKNECDLLYECKVCRSIFRSLANFISHKRVYCKEKYSTPTHGQFGNTQCYKSELLKINKLEREYQECANENYNRAKDDTHDDDDRVPMTKDLTEVIEKVTKLKGINFDSIDTQHVTLQKIPNSSVAMFQNISFNSDQETDSMKNEVQELDEMLSKDKAVLQSDGNFKIQKSVNLDPQNAEAIIQISDEEEEGGELRCKICDLQFSTQKTLRFHMKYKHVETRLVYPCPDCLEIFSTSWSVYRHLFKVHRKTAAQIRRLRESIQAKAFRMNNPPAFYEKRKNIAKVVMPQKMSEEERLDQENQAWMDNMEGDGSSPRCGGCGRSFERRAALVAHTHTCVSRNRALARGAGAARKVEIQIRKDYLKEISAAVVDKSQEKNDDESKITEKENGSDNEEYDDEIKDVDMDNISQTETPKHEDIKVIQEDTDMKYPSAVITNPLTYVPAVNIPSNHNVEKSNFLMFKSIADRDIETTELKCKLCNTKFAEISEVYSHMADHLKWVRYACKLCNYKHYEFSKLPEHVRTVHKLKGNNEFYFSTVKAIEAVKALEMSDRSEHVEKLDNNAEMNETSPNSRRPSRCSSDSGRLSDDSSSSSTKFEQTSRKRKSALNSNKSLKKRKETSTGDQMDEDKEEADNESTSNVKGFDENSSDMDEVDLITKKVDYVPSFSTRRPVRKKTRVKNDDFEYDLSNILRKEAHGYKESPTPPTSKINQYKKDKKLSTQENYEAINKDCVGALNMLSKKAVEVQSAHMKLLHFTTSSGDKDSRLCSIFARPVLPKTKLDKSSPRKDNFEDDIKIVKSNVFDESNTNLKLKLSEDNIKDFNDIGFREDGNGTENFDISAKSSRPIEEIDSTTEDSSKIINIDNKSIADNKLTNSIVGLETIKSLSVEHEKTDEFSIKPDNKLTVQEKPDKKTEIQAVVPIKFRRESLDLIKNPLINKNITEFSKVGMKTKILVIKPINRNKDGSQTKSNPLKFQTIKLKDPKKSTETSSSDQVVVVKVPSVDRVQAISTETNDSEKSHIEPNPPEVHIEPIPIENVPPAITEVETSEIKLQSNV